MYIGFVHTHVLVVILFLIFFLVKAVMLFLGKREQLARLRAKTKVVDMVLGTLILFTGGYLAIAYSGSLPGWLLTKIALVLVAIPLGIIGIARSNKVLAALSLLLFLYVYGVSETKSLNMKPAGSETAGATDSVNYGNLDATTFARAQTIYTENCVNCHGENGNRALGGATRLPESKLTKDQTKAVIANGRGAMAAFKDKLTTQEIEILAEYVTTLHK